MAKTRRKSVLPVSDKLVRRAALRRMLHGAYHRDGFRTIDDIRRALHERAGIVVSRDIVSVDLRELGAIRVRDEQRPEVVWWVIPAFNPNVEDLRDQMDPELIEDEIARKLANHAVDLVPLGNEVFVMTEARAGPLMGYWLSWLSWPEIVLVQEQLDSAIIKCVNADAARMVAARLTGDQRYINVDTEPDGATDAE